MPTEKDPNITAVYVEGTVTSKYTGFLHLKLPKEATAEDIRQAAYDQRETWEDQLRGVRISYYIDRARPVGLHDD